MIKTQQPDGYLGTYLEKDRWTSWDVWVHKYDLIGLLTYYRYTGNEPALAASRKVGDLLCNTFGQDKRDIIKAGEHVGMAATSVLEPMVLLYRATGEKKYLDFCEYILWAWDQPHGPKVLSSLNSGHGVNKTANGKAYEMMSNLVGLCELYRTTGRKELLTAPVNAWKDIVEKRLYLTGSASQHERFGDDFYLPNDQPLKLMETCVTVTWMQLNIQLLRLTGEGRFADQLEKSTYNHLLAAQFPTGAKWCYYTPMEGKKPYGDKTNCCLSSGPRGIALIPTFAFTSDREGIVVNLYESGKASLPLADGGEVTLIQETPYPLSDDSLVRVALKEPKEFTISLRPPAWAEPDDFEVTAERPGVTRNKRDNGYLRFRGEWHDGDRLRIKMRVRVRVVRGEHTNEGKIALMRGPLVLAATQGENAGAGDIKSVALGGSTLQSKQTGRAEAWEIPACRSGAPESVLNVTFTPIADAGTDGSYYQVWFPERM